VQSLEPDRRLLRVHYDWLEAGESAQRTVARLSEQLRRYLDDQAWLENRRIMHLLRDIETQALAVRDQPPNTEMISIDAPAPELTLPLDRPLYSPPLRPKIETLILLEGEDESGSEALFNQFHVDKARLLGQIRQALRQRPRISLGELLEKYPMQHGLAELVAYMDLAANDRHCAFDENQPQLVQWQDANGTLRRSLPLIVFGQ
jgi:hypothetical protein